MDIKEQLVKIGILEEAAKQAGTAVMELFNKGVSSSFKDTSENYESLVTEADEKSQQLIQDKILTALKEAGLRENQVGFIGEENLSIDGEHLFIIDPLDGTTNYKRSWEYFAISIGYMHEGLIQQGVIYDPIRKVLYFAERGKGAYKKTKEGVIIKLEVLPVSLKDSILAIHYNSQSYEEQFRVYPRLIPQVATPKTLGSIALDLCNFTDNKLNLVLNGGSYIWDLAAAQVIIEEAGGQLTNWQGESIKFDFENPKKTMQLMAAHPTNIDSLARLLS